MVFVFPKVDLYWEMFDNNGKVNEKKLFQQTKILFPNLLEQFKTNHPLQRLFKPYIFDFCAFTAGDFFRVNNDIEYTLSMDFYPERLWRLVTKSF